jgi:tripartite-type tricarboxylate transporter receptor subunit TctC
MSRPLRSTFIALAALVAGTVAPWSARGQAAYPSQTIKLIIPASAGGLPDTVARIVGRRLQERLGQSVVVENRPGGNASVAAAALAGSPADGYTFMVQDGSVVSINPQIYAKLAYSPQDILPVALIARAPLFLAAHPKVPVESMQEFIAYVRARPGQLNYGSSGVGSTHHLSMEAIKAALKLEMTHIPYKGTGESVPALLGGHVEAAFSAYPSLSGAVGNKSVKLLATNGAQRSAQAPDVPPVADFIPGFDFAPIVGLYARAGTPPSVIQKIATEVAAIAKEPEAIRQLAIVGIEAVGAGPDEFASALKSEAARVAKAVQAAGIKPQ